MIRRKSSVEELSQATKLEPTDEKQRSNKNISTIFIRGEGGFYIDFILWALVSYAEMYGVYFTFSFAGTMTQAIVFDIGTRNFVNISKEYVPIKIKAEMLLEKTSETIQKMKL